MDPKVVRRWFEEMTPEEQQKFREWAEKVVGKEN